MRLISTLIAVGTLAFGVAQSGQARITIDSLDLDTTFGYGTSVPANGALRVLGWTSYFHLSDGTGWDSGAGSDYLYSFRLSEEVRQAKSIQYILQSAPGDLIWRRTDFGGESSAANGVLAAAGPLILTANIGDASARLSGYAKIVSNDPTWQGEPVFKYFSAPGGSIVPYDLTYTLREATWQPGIFSKGFMYDLKGTVRFQPVSTVPEPSSLTLLGTFLVGCAPLCRRGKRLSR